MVLMYYWTPKRIKELKEKGYKLRLVKHDPGDERASEQAIQETVPHNDIEEANRRVGGPTSREQGSEQASDQASEEDSSNKR